jgi:hypothetical protein
MRHQDDQDRRQSGGMRGFGYGSVELGDGGRVNHRGRGPRGYKRSDERIQEEINDALTYDPLVDASDVEVRVENGEVTLDGHVDDRASRRRAEDIAENVLGVGYVQNNLRVRQQTQQETAVARAASDATRSGGTPVPGRVKTMPASTGETMTPGQAGVVGMTGMMAAGESVGTPGGERGPQGDARRRE